VTPDVLIPRPETEFLVVRLLDLAQLATKEGKHLRIADVGTGSGIVAICAARRLPTAEIHAIDSSAAALTVARSNAQEHGVADRIAFHEGDLLAPLPLDAKLDFVVSNPPYIASHEMDTLAKDVRAFEPRQALEAGPRGTEVIERLIPQAAERLVSGGALLIEISPMIEVAVRKLLADDGRFDVLPTGKDLAGLARVAEARRK
jgi:release factor glutamine methyltransferase